MTPEQSAARAREIAAMPNSPAKHRFFDQLINGIARAHGHAETVDIFERETTGDHGDADGLALAQAAVNECEANPNPGALTGPIPIEGT